MMLNITLPSGQYVVNSQNNFDLAIPLTFDEQQPNHFGATKATATPMTAGNFIGDVRQGGSCNVNEITLNPHCNGTHTETLAHVCDIESPMAITVDALSLPPLMPCVLVSVSPEPGETCKDEYQPVLTANDKVISRAALSAQLEPFNNDQVTAVVIRTQPNSEEKKHYEYGEQHQPAFLSSDAVLYLNERGVEHLILDVPSIDRMHDDGLMSSHRLFWQIPMGTTQPVANSLINKTLTEMAFIEDYVQDGFYFLCLQIPSWVNDAAPSRPVLFSTSPATE